MGYIHRAHHCPKPSDARGGDIWECDECRQQWRLDSLFGIWLPYGRSRTAQQPTTPEDTSGG